MVRDKLNKRELEEQRKQAVEVLERGYDPTEVADIFDVSVSSVRQWRRTHDTDGMDGLEAVPHKGSNLDGTNTLPNRTHEEMESRRKEAIRLLNRDFTASEVAYIFNIAGSTVRKWRREYREGGLPALERQKSLNNDIFNMYENLSSAYLQNILTEVDGSKATQRVMLAINYKQEEKITEKKLSNRYGIDIATVHDWLSRVARSKNESLDIIYDKKPKTPGPDSALPIEKLSKLEEILQEKEEQDKFGSTNWTGNKIAKLAEEEFDKKISSSTGRKYLQDINWKQKKQMEEAIFDFADLFEIDFHNYHKRCLKNTDTNDLISNIIEESSKPTKRLMIAILYKHGISTKILSDWFDVTKGTIYRWFRQIESEPIEEAIYDDRRPGRNKKLTEDEFKELESILEDGPRKYGFTGQIWTSLRVIKIIREEFDTEVTRTTACNYLHYIGWSNKKPTRVATERDEDAINNFRNNRWMQIRSEAKTKNKSIVFIDETKFRLLPTFKHTWAKKGQRATVETVSTFDYIAVIGALVYTPKTQKIDFQWGKQRYNFETKSILEFFQKVLQELSHDPLFLLDNLAAHKSSINRLMKKSDRTISIEWFPEYASDLNPVDRAWGQAKYNEMPNYAPKNLDELENTVEETFNSIKSDKSLLQSFIKYAGLDIER